MARVEIYNYHPIFTQFLASLALSSLRAAPITGPASFRVPSCSASLPLSETNRTVAGELPENGPRRNLQLSPHFYSVSGQFGPIKPQSGPDYRSGVLSGPFLFWRTSTVRDKSYSSWRTARKWPASKFTTITPFLLSFWPVWPYQASGRPRLPVRRPFGVVPVLAHSRCSTHIVQ